MHSSESTEVAEERYLKIRWVSGHLKRNEERREHVVAWH